jgi:hypothetical protein
MDYDSKYQLNVKKYKNILGMNRELILSKQKRRIFMKLRVTGEH